MTRCSLHQRSFGRGRKTKVKALKKARLERAGWVVGDTAEFLNLNPREAQFVELKLALAAGVRQLRERRGMTQAALASRKVGLQPIACCQDGSRVPVRNRRLDDAVTAGHWSDPWRDREADQALDGPAFTATPIVGAPSRPTQTPVCLAPRKYEKHLAAYLVASAGRESAERRLPDPRAVSSPGPTLA